MCVSSTSLNRKNGGFWTECQAIKNIQSILNYGASNMRMPEERMSFGSNLYIYDPPATILIGFACPGTARRCGLLLGKLLAEPVR